MPRGMWLATALAGALAACAPTAGETRAHFDLDGNWSTSSTFFDHPFPSDLRLTDRGAPDLRGFPNPKQTAMVDNLIAGASDRLGFSSMTVALFRFDGPLTPRAGDSITAAVAAAPFLLVDIDPSSPDRGRLFPTLVQTLPGDDYLPDFGLAIAPWPGTILPGDRSYAAVVLRRANDADGAPLAVPAALAELAHGRTPSGARGTEARAIYAPLFDTLEDIGVDPDEVAAATVFTTADVVADLATVSDSVVAGHDVAIENLRLDDDGDQAALCELVGSVNYPQFQAGDAPFNVEGLIAFDASGVPIKTGELTAPVRIAIPKGAMPSAGFPLMIYFHGSGGNSSELIDLGPIAAPGGEPQVRRGPASVLAPVNIASAASALPVNPERLEGASKFEYLNFSNLRAMRDTFRQGVFEQRLYLEALATIQIPPSALAGCAGVDLAGATAIRFDAEKIVAMGLSMGGMYANIVSAVEPAIRAAVPAGAGGFWNRFVLDTRIVPDTGALLSVLLGTSDALSFTHPVLQLAALAWEATEPMIYMRRLAARPLPGHPSRSIYQPVGQNDRFFDEKTFDAAALALGTRQTGDELWPTMQESLALDGRDGIDGYPAAGNARSVEGTAFTGVVAQYAGDGLQDPHVIFAQLPSVKNQYRCFFRSFLETGVAIVSSPSQSCD